MHDYKANQKCCQDTSNLQPHKHTHNVIFPEQREKAQKRTQNKRMCLQNRVQVMATGHEKVRCVCLGGEGVSGLGQTAQYNS